MSLESLLFSGKSGNYWNGVLPTQDANTLIRLHTFNSTADIIDKGPLSIPVTITGTFTRGQDGHGTYLQFTTSNYLSFSNAALTYSSFDITMILGNVVFPGGQYGPPLIDARPNLSNGNYIAVSHLPNAPFTTALYYATTDGPAASASTPAKDFPAVVVVKCRPTSVTVLINGIVVHTWNRSFSWPQQSYKIGRNAYAQNVAIPNLQARVYYFDIKKVV